MRKRGIFFIFLSKKMKLSLSEVSNNSKPVNNVTQSVIFRNGNRYLSELARPVACKNQFRHANFT